MTVEPLHADETQSRRRRRNREATRPSERAPNYRQLRHPFPAQEMFSADEIGAIHDTALRVLEELGMKVLLPEARALYTSAGAKVVDDMVFIGREIIEAAITSAPKSWTLRASDPRRDQRYEQGAMIFMAGSGCPNASDRERGRRPGTMADFVETLKLCQAFDVIHMLGPTVEPQDIPVALRHYATIEAQLAHSDKPMFLYSRGPGQVAEGFEMIQTALNLTDDDFARDVWVSTVINTNSPRLLDNPMAKGLIDFARAGQMCIVTPFCLAGAMAPITPAGALALQHAEALAAITLTQIAKAGSPVSYGGFSSNVYMKSGAPAYGTPEHLKMQIGGGQLARHIGLPWRTASGAASNTPDMQAAQETTMGIWGASLAHGTLIVHAAGWQEGGLTFGYEKFINDIEVLQGMAELTQRPSGSAAEIGFDAIAEVPPGGHFFATQHTMERYQTAFYEPLVADLNNFGSWTENGALTSTERATGVWQQVLRDFRAPEGGDERVARIQSLIDAGKKRGGAPVMD